MKPNLEMTIRMADDQEIRYTFNGKVDAKEVKQMCFWAMKAYRAYEYDALYRKIKKRSESCK
jgi:hypothetical protein